MIAAVVVALTMTTPMTGAADAAGLMLSLGASKTRLRTGEPLTFTLTLRNTGNAPVRLEFPTAQRFDVVLEDRSGREVWRWSGDQMFAQVIGEETIPAGGRRTWKATARVKLPPGRYTGVATVTAANPPAESRVSITVR